MTETNDGFLISEADMKIRGPGDMEGTQQSGLAFNLKVADLAKDGQILSRAREVAKSVLRGNRQLLAPGCNATPPAAGDMAPMLLSPQSLATVAGETRLRFARAVDWSRIS